jgi:hypothetical protein
LRKVQGQRRRFAPAFEYLDAKVADRIDEKTLLSHIKKFFDMPNTPRTNAEWKQAIERCFEEALSSKNSGNFVVNSSRGCDLN